MNAPDMEDVLCLQDHLANNHCPSVGSEWAVCAAEAIERCALGDDGHLVVTPQGPRKAYELVDGLHLDWYVGQIAELMGKCETGE